MAQQSQWFMESLLQVGGMKRLVASTKWILALVAVAIGVALLLYSGGGARLLAEVAGVPEARRAMGINLPAYRMDQPGVPINDPIVDDLEALGAKWMRFAFRAKGSPPAIRSTIITRWSTVCAPGASRPWGCWTMRRFQGRGRRGGRASTGRRLSRWLPRWWLNSRTISVLGDLERGGHWPYPVWYGG